MILNTKIARAWLDWHTKTFRRPPAILRILRFHPENLKASLLLYLQWMLGLAKVSVGQGTSKADILRVVRIMKPVAVRQELMRIGGSGDGGYLVPKDLHGVEACFSPGVALNASFETALAELGIRSFLADYSVDSPPVENPLFDFQKRFLGVQSEDSKYIRLDEWVNQKHPGQDDLLLQMDIEGAEWPILADVQQDTLRRFRIIALEIHDLDVMLTSHAGLRLAEAVFQKLQENFRTVHIHANNCTRAINYRGLKIPPILELTLLRKDRIENTHVESSVKIPHPLDQRNVPYFGDVKVPLYWFE